MIHRDAGVSAWRRAATLLALAVLCLRLLLPAPLADGASVQLASSLGDVPICHADAAPSAPTSPDKPAAAHHCALCPVCQLANAPALMPAGTLLPEPRVAGPAPVAPLRHSTAPPLPERYAAAPRGPPVSAV